jgi:RNA polymerase sigma factor (TIGR02999 family)
MPCMSDVTRLIDAISHGDPRAADELLPLLYGELRQLAADRLAHEKPGQTLQATALVHEAYLRLVGDDGGPRWDGRAHFFGAASEAMRRILIDRARRNRRVKHGGEFQRVDLDAVHAASAHAASDRDAEMLAVNDLLDELARLDAGAAEVVKLRYFAGYTLEEIADLLEVSRSTVQRRWSFARAWLFARLPQEDAESQQVSP